MFGSKRFPSVLSAVVLGAVANGVAVFGRIWTAHRHRGVVTSLLDFDDHMLRDIGITRGDVAASLTMSPLRDPSTRLRILAVERRAARRAQRREVLEVWGRESGAIAAPTPEPSSQA